MAISSIRVTLLGRAELQLPCIGRHHEAIDHQRAHDFSGCRHAHISNGTTGKRRDISSSDMESFISLTSDHLHHLGYRYDKLHRS